MSNKQLLTKTECSEQRVNLSKIFEEEKCDPKYRSFRGVGFITNFDIENGWMYKEAAKNLGLEDYIQFYTKAFDNNGGIIYGCHALYKTEKAYLDGVNVSIIINEVIKIYEAHNSKRRGK